MASAKAMALVDKSKQQQPQKYEPQVPNSGLPRLHAVVAALPPSTKQPPAQKPDPQVPSSGLPRIHAVSAAVPSPTPMKDSDSVVHEHVDPKRCRVCRCVYCVKCLTKTDPELWWEICQDCWFLEIDRTLVKNEPEFIALMQAKRELELDRSDCHPEVVLEWFLFAMVTLRTLKMIIDAVEKTAVDSSAMIRQPTSTVFSSSAIVSSSYFGGVTNTVEVSCRYELTPEHKNPASKRWTRSFDTKWTIRRCTIFCDYETILFKRAMHDRADMSDDVVVATAGDAGLQSARSWTAFPRSPTPSATRSFSPPTSRMDILATVAAATP